MGDQTERSLIHSPEQEAALCGYVLQSPDVWADVRDLEPGRHFTTPKPRYLWRAFQALEERGVPVDLPGVVDLLRGNGQLHAVGGPTGIAALAEAKVAPNPTRAGIQASRQALIDAAGLREAAHAADQLRVACERREDLGQALAQFHRRIYGDGDVLAARPTGPVRLRDSLEQTMQWLVQVQEDPDSGQLKTGLASLDKVLRIQPGDYVLLAGRPSMGKSALGDQLGMGIARSTGGHVLNANFEMKLKEQINLRRLCREARLSSEVFLSGQAGEVEMAKLINGGSRLQDVLGRVWDVGVEARTIGSLRACARRLAEEHDLVCIVVDYLQLMEGPAGSHSREAAVSAISRGLRMLALDLNVAVIALSQLNREVEKRKDKRPQMSDLRESGSLEQDASSLAFVYRDEYYHPPGSEEHDPELAGIAEVIVAKQRNGQRNLTAHLGFDGPSTRFFDQDAYGAGGW